MATRETPDVPAGDVPERVRKLILFDDASEIVLTRQADGSYTVKATTP